MLGDNPYCSQFQLYRGKNQQNWAASIEEPLPVGWHYDEVTEVIIFNGWIDSDTGEFSATAKINDKSLSDVKDLYLSVESRVALGADGFCLPSESYSQILVEKGEIPNKFKSSRHYHSDAIQWDSPPTIIDDTMRFSGKALPGVMRLTWQEGYCSQFHLYELDESGYHYIDSISPMLPAGRFWTDPVIAEVTSQSTGADGTFEATVKVDGNALRKYRNPVLVVEGPSVLDSNTNQCSDSEVLSGIDIQSSSVLLSPTPAATLTPLPLASLLTAHNTQNMRWLEGAHPALYRQIQGFPWAQDGLSEREAKTIDELLYIGVGNISNLRACLNLAWVQDDISETEYGAIYRLQALAYENEDAAASIIAMPWYQDSITDTEQNAIRWLHGLAYNDKDAAATVIGMPFLTTLEYDDVLAIWGMHSLAHDDLLAALMDTPAWQSGFTDAQTTLVAAAGTLNDRQEVTRMMNPGYADIETLSRGTELTPDLKISIVRTGSKSQPWTAEGVRSAIEFAERTMQLPLPVSHVITVLNEKAFTENFVGTNFGFAFGYDPEDEQPRDTFDGHYFQSGLVHEVAHYYWRVNEDWIDEGVASTFEYMYGAETGLSPGLLEVTSRENCTVHDLQTLTGLNPDKQEDFDQFHCNYYLGQSLFLELLESLGDDEFRKGLHELYRLSQIAEDANETPGIAEVRQAFHNQAETVEKHWSGKLNAPENRPFDEGVDRTGHDLIQWDQYPTYDGDSVTFRGTLLGDAVLSNETLRDATEGNTYQNFTLSLADEYEFLGIILPPVSDERYWTLDDPGDTNAIEYGLEDRSFTIKFRLRQGLKNPQDYVVIVWGYPDATRTPYIGDNIDILGYARIRTE